MSSVNFIPGGAAPVRVVQRERGDPPAVRPPALRLRLAGSQGGAAVGVDGLPGLRRGPANGGAAPAQGGAQAGGGGGVAQGGGRGARRAADGAAVRLAAAGGALKEGAGQGIPGA